jgi:hypothetical protein
MLRLLQFVVLKTGFYAVLLTINVRTKLLFPIFYLGPISGEIGLPIVNLNYVQSIAPLTANPKVSFSDKRLRFWEK